MSHVLDRPVRSATSGASPGKADPEPRTNASPIAPRIKRYPSEPREGNPLGIVIRNARRRERRRSRWLDLTPDALAASRKTYRHPNSAPEAAPA